MGSVHVVAIKRAYEVTTLCLISKPPSVSSIIDDQLNAPSSYQINPMSHLTTQCVCFMSRRLLGAIRGTRSNLSASTSGLRLKNLITAYCPGSESVTNGRPWDPGGRKGAVTVQNRSRAERVRVDREMAARTLPDGRWRRRRAV